MTENSSKIINDELSAAEKADAVKVFVWKDSDMISPYTQALRLDIEYAKQWGWYFKDKTIIFYILSIRW